MYARAKGRLWEVRVCDVCLVHSVDRWKQGRTRLLVASLSLGPGFFFYDTHIWLAFWTVHSLSYPVPKRGWGQLLLRDDH